MASMPLDDATEDLLHKAVLEGWLADFPLQNAELVTQRQHLGSELGIGLVRTRARSVR